MEKQNVRRVDREAVAAKLPAYRLAIYDPCDEKDSLEFIGPVFRDCPFDRMVIRLSIAKFNKISRSLSFCMAAFPVED